MLCPSCAADLEPYGTPDVHTHWCEDCSCGYILSENGDKWLSLFDDEDYTNG